MTTIADRKNQAIVHSASISPAIFGQESHSEFDIKKPTKVSKYQNGFIVIQKTIKQRKYTQNFLNQWFIDEIIEFIFNGFLPLTHSPQNLHFCAESF